METSFDGTELPRVPIQSWSQHELDIPLHVIIIVIVVVIQLTGVFLVVVVVVVSIEARKSVCFCIFCTHA